MSEQVQMSKEEALQIIKNVAAAFVGNLKDHQAVQTALIVLAKELEKNNVIKESTLEKPY